MNKLVYVAIIAIALLGITLQATLNLNAQQFQEMRVYQGSSVLLSKDITEVDSIIVLGFNVPDNINGIEINGLVWSTRNVASPGSFVSKPEDYGMFYQWNRKIGWSSSDPMVNHEGGTTWDPEYPSGTTWEVSNNVCPAGWRVPTQQELQSLLNSGSYWGKLNGVSGRFFGSGNQRLFFPAAGYRDFSDGWLYYQGNYGGYWSSTEGDSGSALFLYFNSGDAGMGYGNRTYGFSVRCVAE